MFDVMVNATGQNIGEDSLWAREVNWFWSAANRPALSQGTPVVAYRGTPTRVRYVRIINRSDATGSLSELKVVPAKL
jgi:hypothetical protein